MVINKFALKMVDVTFEEYIEYCIRYNKKPEKHKTKVEFFAGIRDGSIIRDIRTKKIVCKKNTIKRSENNEEE